MKILIDNMELELKFGSPEQEKWIGGSFAIITNFLTYDERNVKKWFKENLPNVQIDGLLLIFHNKNDEIYLRMFAV